MLLALATLPPLVAQASGTVIGSFTMFERILRYHVELSVRTQQGDEKILLRSIASHLSPEARTILLPADGMAIGADQVDLAAAGLADLATLACRLRPGASAARAVMTDAPFDSKEERVREASVRCVSAGR
ncbi:MAG TPA: hypothetical protein VGK73_40550 [Polyangiaceae bacterium]